MYILCKSIGEYSDIGWSIIGYSNDENVLKLIKKKLDDEQVEIDTLAHDFLYKDSYDAGSLYKKVTLEYDTYIAEIIKHNKQLVIDKPKYLPYMNENGEIKIPVDRVFYYIEDAKELFV